MGVNNIEYWNRFHINHRCPNERIFPRTGTQKKSESKITQINPEISPSTSVSIFPKITEPTKEELRTKDEELVKFQDKIK